MWTRPFTGEYAWPRSHNKVFEYACHEASYALEGIMQGARFTRGAVPRRRARRHRQPDALTGRIGRVRTVRASLSNPNTSSGAVLFAKGIRVSRNNATGLRQALELGHRPVMLGDRVSLAWLQLADGTGGVGRVAVGRPHRFIGGRCRSHARYRRLVSTMRTTPTSP